VPTFPEFLSLAINATPSAAEDWGSSGTMTHSERKMEIMAEAAYLLNGNVQFTLNLPISITSRTSDIISTALSINDFDITNGGITRRIL